MERKKHEVDVAEEGGDDLFDLGDEEEFNEGETDVSIPDLSEEADDANIEADPPAKTESPKKAPRATKTPRAVTPQAGAMLGEKALGMTADIPIQIVAVLGKKSMTLQDLLQLELGQLIDLGQPVSTLVDLVANGKLVAKGELIDIDGQLGVKIIRMVR